MKGILSFFAQFSLRLSVLMFPLVFAPWTFEKFEFNKHYFLFFLVSLGLLFWLAEMILFDHEIRIRRTLLDVPILFLFLVMLVSAFFSQDRISSFFGSGGRFSDGLVGFASLIGLYFLCTNLTGERKTYRLHPLLGLFLFATFLVLILSLLSFFRILEKLEFLPQSMRDAGWNPVSLGPENLLVFLAIGFVVLVGIVDSSPKPDFLETKSGFKRGFKKVFGIIFLLGLAGFVFGAGFQSSLMVVIFGMLALLFGKVLQRVRLGEKLSLKRVWLPLLIALLAFFWQSQNPIFPNQNRVLFDFLKPDFYKGKSDFVLENSWSIAWESAKESLKNFLVGSGIGTFQIDFSRHRPAWLNETLFWNVRVDRGGNFLSEVLATTGVLGLFLYFAIFALVSLIFLVLMSLKQDLEVLKEKSTQSGALVLFAGIVSLIVTFFTLPRHTVFLFSFWLFTGMSASLIPKTQDFVISLKKYLEIALLARLILVGFAVILGWMWFGSIRFYLADIYFAKSLLNLPPLTFQRDFARTFPFQLENRIFLLTKAVNFNPWQAEYKMNLAKLHLARMLQELAKPVSEQNSALLALDAQRAILWAKGGEDPDCRIEKAPCKKILGAVELAKNRVEMWETLGIIYRELSVTPGASDWAVKSFEKAVELEPTNPIFYVELAKLEILRKNFKEARRHLEKALLLKPNFPEALFQLAFLEEKEENIKRATRILEELVQSYPKDIDYLFQLGRMYYNGNQLEKAILKFQEVLKIDPNNSNAHFSLGLVLEKQGKKKEALLEYQKALELNPENEELQKKVESLK